MQPIREEDIKQLIKEGKKEGKDVSELEGILNKVKGKRVDLKEASLPMGEIKVKKTEQGDLVIESTGPAREEDFDD